MISCQIYLKHLLGYGNLSYHTKCHQEQSSRFEMLANIRTYVVNYNRVRWAM